MKKLAYIAGIVLLGWLVLGGVYVGMTRLQAPPTLHERFTKEKQVHLLIDFGQGKMATYPSVSAYNAYDVLKHVGEEIGVKAYEFGVMVEKIGEKENSKEYAWMYFVNGKPGEVASDKHDLMDGDRVEWKYEKIAQ